MKELKKMLTDGTNENIRMPTVTFYERDRKTGDKSLKTEPLNSYMNHIKLGECIVSPSMTTYLRTGDVRSFISDITEEGTIERSKVKNDMYIAQTNGDKELEEAKAGESGAIKLGINSISGALVSKGSILVNPSAHSTLTSTSRTVTSTSNLLHEYINGSRFYSSYIVVQGSILSIIQNLRERGGLQEKKWREVIPKYNIRIPTVKNMMDLIRKSSVHYWKDEKSMNKLENLLHKLTDIEKCAFTYTNDLYQMRLYNDRLVRDMLEGLCIRDIRNLDGDPHKLIKDIPDDILNHLHHIYLDETTGMGTVYANWDKELVVKMVSTGYACMETLDKYKDVLRTIFCSEDYGPNMAHLYDMHREHIPGSDTDSTIGSLDGWIEWYSGGTYLNKATISIASAAALFCGQILDNSMRQFSINMNLDDKYVDNIKMKSELTTLSIAVGSRSKHYFTRGTVMETNVLKNKDLIVKGVELKSSTIPKEIKGIAHRNMEGILRDVENNRKISLLFHIRETLKIEKMIASEILNGGTKFFKPITIKPASAYKNPESSPYNWCVWWNGTFGKAYGSSMEAPYKTMKIPTTLNNKTAIKSLLASIDNAALKVDFTKWLQRSNKSSLPTLYIPLEFLNNNGIPNELKEVINLKKVTLDLTSIFYRILSMLGYFKPNSLTLHEYLNSSSCVSILDLDIDNINKGEW